MLTLTWWPLARDCLFYVVDLIVLYIFFRDQKIELYESLVLMGLYFVYVAFMSYNNRVERWVKISILGVKESDFERLKNEDTLRKEMDRAASMAAEKAEKADTGSAGAGGVRALRRINSGAHSDDGSVASTSQSVRNLSKKLRQESVKNSLAVLDAMDSRPSSPGTLAVEPPRVVASPGGVSVHGSGFKPGGLNKVHAELFSIGKSDSTALRKAAVERAQRTLVAVANAEEADDEGIDLSWPDDKYGRAYFVIAAPLMFLLAFTIPNVKKKKYLWPLVFSESILYIGFFSYFMVWWATSVGAVAGISDVVMGYTFLAAGTSVPDLMSRYACKAFPNPSDCLPIRPTDTFFRSFQRDRGATGLGGHGRLKQHRLEHLRHNLRVTLPVDHLEPFQQLRGVPREFRFPGVLPDLADNNARRRRVHHRPARLDDDQNPGCRDGGFVRRVPNPRVTQRGGGDSRVLISGWTRSITRV